MTALVAALRSGCQSLSARLADDGPEHLRALTGIRGWAAIWVSLYHVWGMSGHPVLALPLGPLQVDLTPLVALGGAGVTVFFVLSGYLLATPFARWQAGLTGRPALRRYFVHRVARVFPAYYGQLAVLLLIAWLLPGQPAPADAAALWRHLAMLFVPPPIGTSPLNPVWWTLPIEFSFYLALPFLAFLLRPGRWWWLVIACALSMWTWRHAVVTNLADSPIQARVYAAYQLPGALDMFGLGMLAAMIDVQRARLPAWLLAVPSRNGQVLGAIGLLVAAVYWIAGDRQHYWLDYPIFYLWTPALALATAALILAATTGNRLAAVLFGNRFLVFAGVISYSVYLWHFPVLAWITSAHSFQGGSGFLRLLAIGMPMIFLISSLSYLLIERPVMRLRHRTTPARPTTA